MDLCQLYEFQPSYTLVAFEYRDSWMSVIPTDPYGDESLEASSRRCRYASYTGSNYTEGRCLYSGCITIVIHMHSRETGRLGLEIGPSASHRCYDCVCVCVC